MWDQYLQLTPLLLFVSSLSSSLFTTCFQLFSRENRSSHDRSHELSPWFCCPPGGCPACAASRALKPNCPSAGGGRPSPGALRLVPTLTWGLGSGRSSLSHCKLYPAGSGPSAQRRAVWVSSRRREPGKEGTETVCLDLVSPPAPAALRCSRAAWSRLSPPQLRWKALARLAGCFRLLILRAFLLSVFFIPPGFSALLPNDCCFSKNLAGPFLCPYLPAECSRASSEALLPSAPPPSSVHLIRGHGCHAIWPLSASILTCLSSRHLKLKCVMSKVSKGSYSSVQLCYSWPVSVGAKSPLQVLRPVP